VVVILLGVLGFVKGRPPAPVTVIQPALSCPLPPPTSAVTMADVVPAAKAQPIAAMVDSPKPTLTPTRTASVDREVVRAVAAPPPRPAIVRLPAARPTSAEDDVLGDQK
jgi:hypothetical protein